MPKQKNHLTVGLETLLNDSRTNPFTADGAKGFKAIMEASNLPMTEVFKHIGKQKKAPKPKEDDKSKARLEKLEQESQA